MQVIYRHKKTGHLYRLLAHGIDCTNSRDGTPAVVYFQDNAGLMRSLLARLLSWIVARLVGAVYVRETEEFEEKFEAMQ